MTGNKVPKNKKASNAECSSMSTWNLLELDVIWRFTQMSHAELHVVLVELNGLVADQIGKVSDRSQELSVDHSKAISHHDCDFT